MAIDATMRGLLEQYIDSVVIAIPNIVKVFFDPSNKALQIHDENDFAVETFVSIQARYPDQEEIEQINTIISKRVSDIRDSISNARLT